MSIQMSKEKYPSIAEKFDFSDPASAPLLIKEVFEKGGKLQSTRNVYFWQKFKVQKLFFRKLINLDIEKI